MDHRQLFAGPYISSKKCSIWQRKHRPLQESDKFRQHSACQKSSMFFRNHKYEQIILITTIYSMEERTFFLQARSEEKETQHENRKWNVLKSTTSRCKASFSVLLLKIHSSFLDVLLGNLHISSAIGTDESNKSNSLNVCNRNISLPDSHRKHANPKNIPGKTSLPNWWSLHWSLTGIGKFSTNAPTSIISSSIWFYQSSSIMSYAIYTVSKIVMEFQRISPSQNKQDRLQPYSIRWFLYSAHRPLGNPIRVGSQKCNVRRFHDESSERFAKFHRKICQIPSDCQC